MISQTRCGMYQRALSASLLSGRYSKADTHNFDEIRDFTDLNSAAIATTKFEKHGKKKLKNLGNRE